jgi:hypothetical protein
MNNKGVSGQPSVFDEQDSAANLPRMAIKGTQEKRFILS